MTLRKPRFGDFTSGIRTPGISEWVKIELIILIRLGIRAELLS